ARVVAGPAHDGSMAVRGERDRAALICVSHSASANELLALLSPDTVITGEHPCRPNLAVVGPPAHNGRVAVGGQRYRHALAGASRSAGADKLVPLLPPDTATTGEHPRALRPPPTDNGGVAVGRQSNGHSLAKRQC